MRDLTTAVCKCGHKFSTSTPLGCPKCDKWPTHEEIAKLQTQLAETRKLLEVQLAVGDKLEAEVKRHVDIAKGLSDIRLRLEAELVALREAYDAANAFIDNHVADPDITKEMQNHYLTYLELRDALEK